MSVFRGSDFEIELPADCSDESTYAFAFPSRSSFRPSIVVKTERLSGKVELPAYAAKQLDKIRELLQNVSIVSVGPAEHRGLPAYGSVFDWGDATRRVRQKQRYLLLNDPHRVVTLTATSLHETFPEAEALFDAVFLSFKPASR